MDNRGPKWFRLLLNGKLNLLSNQNGFRLWSFPVYSARESNKGFCWVLQEKKVGGWGAREYRDMVYAENVLRTLHLCLILYTIFANWQLQITSHLWFSESVQMFKWPFISFRWLYKEKFKLLFCLFVAFRIIKRMESKRRCLI